MKNTYLKTLPSKKMFFILGNGNHTMNSAILDLIDNSIEARTEKQLNGIDTLIIKIDYDFKKKSFSIKDNGTGVSYDLLANAMSLGKTTKVLKMGLGGYGLGLKTDISTLTQDPNFEIHSRVEGEKEKIIVIFDNKWYNKEDWNVQVKRVPKTKNSHGFEIYIKETTSEKMKNMTNDKINKLYDTISRATKPIIENEKVEIYLNNKKIIAPKDAVGIKGYPQTETIIFPYGTFNVSLNVLEENEENRKNFGFTIYRFGRAIKFYTNFGVENKPESIRNKLVGEIYLNDLKPTYEKMDFIENEVYFEAKKAFENSEVLKNAIKIIEKKQNTSNKKEEDICNIVYNFLPNINTAFSQLNNEELMNSDMQFKKNSKGLIGGIIDDFPNPIIIPPPRNNKTGRKNKKRDKVKNIIKESPLPFMIKFVIKSLDLFKRKDVSYDKDKNILNIDVNKEFSAYKALEKSHRMHNDLLFYINELICESIAEYNAGDSYMDKILYKTKLLNLAYKNENDRKKYLENI